LDSCHPSEGQKIGRRRTLYWLLRDGLLTAKRVGAFLSEQDSACATHQDAHRWREACTRLLPGQMGSPGSIERDSWSTPFPSRESHRHVRSTRHCRMFAPRETVAGLMRSEQIGELRPSWPQSSRRIRLASSRAAKLIPPQAIGPGGPARQSTSPTAR